MLRSKYAAKTSKQGDVMAQPAKTNKGLGKGLSALMGDNTPRVVASTPEQPTNLLPITSLVAGKYQPRRHFDEAALNELADSIARHGLMQPIVVRQTGTVTYEIIAGERRFRAAQITKLKMVPVIVRELTDAQALELALIENIQRTDLNPLEEAAGYQRLMDEFGYTQEKLAPVVGKSRSHVANLLRLLKLPESIKNRIDTGELTMGHARALLMAKDPEALAQQIIAIGLSVRQAEDLAKGTAPAQANEGAGAAASPQQKSGARASGQGSKSHTNATKSDDVVQLENMLADSLGLKVSITQGSGQTGEVVITYDTLTQLDEILRRLSGGA
jgi:ParB family chromosome partitioning protein